MRLLLEATQGCGSRGGRLEGGYGLIFNLVGKGSGLKETRSIPDKLKLELENPEMCVFVDHSSFSHIL
jgi:hypothetical protein